MKRALLKMALIVGVSLPSGWLVRGSEPQTIHSAESSTIADSGSAQSYDVEPAVNVTPTNWFELRFRNTSVKRVLEYLSQVAGFIIVSEVQPSGAIDLWTDQAVEKARAVELLNAALQPQGLAAIAIGRKLKIVSSEKAKHEHLGVSFGNDPAKIANTQDLITQIIPVRSVEAAKLLKDLQPLVSSDATLTANDSANAIVVTDRQSNIQKLAEIILAIDASAEDGIEIKVFPLENADPRDMADLLRGLFPDPGSSSEDQSPFPGPPGGGPGGGPAGFAVIAGPELPGANSGSDSSDLQGQRLKKRARVIAQAEERTASVVVAAAQSLMPQIEGIIAQLDSNAKGRQTVSLFQFKNSNPTALKQMLKDLFQKNSASNNRTDSTQTDPLANRLNSQNQQNGNANQNGTSNRNPGGGDVLGVVRQ